MHASGTCSFHTGFSGAHVRLIPGNCVDAIEAMRLQLEPMRSVLDDADGAIAVALLQRI